MSVISGTATINGIITKVALIQTGFYPNRPNENQTILYTVNLDETKSDTVTDFTPTH